MTAELVCLTTFLGEQDVDEIWSARWARNVTRRLTATRKSGQWAHVIAELRAEFDEVLRDGDIGYHTAAHILFAIDLLDTPATDVDTAGVLTLGHLAQLGLSDDAWRRALEILAQTAPAPPGSGRTPPKPTMTQLPEACLTHLVHRGQLASLSLLFEAVRGRIRPLTQQAVRHSTSHAVWVHSLARLIAALGARRFVPVTLRSEGGGATITLRVDARGHGVGALTEFPGEERWDPLAAHLLSADRLREARRDEAYFAEQFAHVFSAVMLGCHRPEHTERLVTSVTALTTADDRLRAREQIRLMRSRHELPAYLFAQLDSMLR